jgi:phage tail-like protein
VRITDFTAAGDIVGRRVKISWEVVLDDGEPLGPGPTLTLRRKERDFEFPAPGAGADPFLVYDSAGFPPAGTVTEVELVETIADGRRTTTTAESVSRELDGTHVEVLRRTRAIAFDPERKPIGYREEILDIRESPQGLDPGTTYYYELAGPALAAEDPDDFRAVATPTEVHRSGRWLYEQLPGIVRRHDVSRGPVRETGAIPEATPENGQLRRFVDVFGAAVDHLRSRADGLRGLHDVDTVDHRMLPHLASWLGWDLSHGLPISLQRHEIKHAAHLYQITGTVPGAVIWVKRLTGWDARIKEFWRNVFFTNDIGNPHDPDDPGSRTLDTADRALREAMGTFDDQADYVSDTGTDPGVRYATNVVGVFAEPGPEDSADDVLRKRARVLASASVFLPFNLRPVVVLEAETVTETSDENFGLTRTDDDTG